MNHDSDEELIVVPEDANESVVCRRAQLLVVLIATILHGIFLSQAKPLQSANDRSRWCTVWSLVERGTFQIDEIRQRPGWDTIDLVYVDQHFYSTKPPLLTCVVAGVTWCVERIFGWDLLKQTQPVTVVVLLVINLLPFAISLLAWIVILDRVAHRAWTRLFVMTVVGFGTLLTPFLMTLNNHTVAAASVTLALYAIIKILKVRDRSASNWQYVLCGFASSWAVANELPAACLAAILLVIAYRQSWKQTLTYFVPAAIVPIAALFVTNVVATGSLKPFYADYGTDKYRFVIEGVPSYWMEPHGVDRNLDSPWGYLIHCTIGHHGLFSLTPIALLALAGWLLSFRQRDRAIRLLLQVGAITTVVVIAFYMTRTQNYNYGGVSCGLRWALWLTPLWIFALIPVLDFFAGSLFSRGLSISLLAVSMFSAWQPVDNPWRQPWLFQWMEARRWIDYSDPDPVLPHPLWTWFATLPQPADNEAVWVEFVVTAPGSASRFIRLTARPDSTGVAGELLEIEVRESSTSDQSTIRMRTLHVDVNKFAAGNSPVEFMRWFDPKVTAGQQQADLAFVRGLPRKVPYDARLIRYLKTPLRTEAFRCVLAAAHVAYAADENDTPLVYRCDTWLTDDVPFGVAQVEFRISQPDNGAMIFQERWTLHDCSPNVVPYKPAF